MAAALVGALAEALVGPLSPDEHPDEDALVGGLVAFVTTATQEPLRVAA